MNERNRRIRKIVVASLLVASANVALYIFLVNADAILVAIGLFVILFVAMTVLAGYVLERYEDSSGPGSEEGRLANFWRLPPR